MKSKTVQSEAPPAVAVQRVVRQQPGQRHDEREAWWCPTCKIGLVWHQVTYEETHDSRYGGCGEPVQPNDQAQTLRLPPKP